MLAVDRWSICVRVHKLGEKTYYTMFPASCSGGVGCFWQGGEEGGGGGGAAYAVNICIET